MKKRVFIVALAICLIATISLGTLAYFTDAKFLTNYFAVAGIEDPTDPDETINPDDLFSMKLDETDIANSGQRTEAGNTYTDIMPGSVLVKDPTVTNTGKYDQWVRVIVTITDATDWMAVCAEEHNAITDLTNIFAGHDETKWTVDKDAIAYDAEADTLTYTYYLNNKLAPEASVTLFSQVTIPVTFTVEDMAALSTFQMIIRSEAIQADNNGATAMEGFENFS